MEKVDIKYVTEDEKEGIQLSPDIYVYQGHGMNKVGLGLFRLDTLGICLVESGIYTIHLNGVKYRLHSGDLLVCHPNDIYGDVTFSKNFHGTIIFASMNMISGLIDNDYLRQCLQILKSKPVYTLEESDFALFRNYSSTIASHIQSGIYKRYATSGILVLQAFLSDIFRHVISPGTIQTAIDGRTRPEVIYQQFLNVLLSTNVKPRDIESFSRQLCVSPKYLSFVCRRQSGKTAPQIIREHIMNDARRYLVGTDMTVKEIAFRLKFSNYPFFCKVVKKHFGKTPLEIRRQNINPKK